MDTVTQVAADGRDAAALLPASGGDPTDPLSPTELRRYSRHLLIPEVGVEGQRRLKNARVLCVGAGGLGSPVLMYLAAAGVGTIGVADFDVVDESNLQRQIVHRQSDVGRPKVDSAADTLAGINPLVTVVRHAEPIGADNALELFGGYDLVVDGADNFTTRYIVNDAAVLAGKPYVWGSVFRFEGQASTFWAERGPCYRCLYPEPPPPGMVPSCAEGGVLGVVCASVGAVQATEAVKVLLGLGEPLVGRLLTYDALTMRTHERRIRKDPRCELCGPEATITRVQEQAASCVVPDPLAAGVATADPADATVTPRELKALLDGDGPIHLVDVREPTEFAIVSIPGATLLPKGEFARPDVVQALPTDRPVILYCKAGSRSAEVLRALAAAGRTDVRHLEGGVLAWVRDVEPHKPTY